MLARATASTALAAAAKVMAVGSRLANEVAERVRPDTPPAGGDGRATAGQEDPAPARDREAARGAVRMPPTEPVPEVPSHVRTHETHVEELAARTAAEVLPVIPELSTEELGRLYEHEAANKKRKTVLTAIERAADAHVPQGQAPGHEEPLPEAGGVPVGGGPVGGGPADRGAG